MANLCIRGLRYPVETILELLSSGMTADEILAEYEDLEQEDILAALSFATRLSQVECIKISALWNFSLTLISPVAWFGGCIFLIVKE